MKRAFEEVKPDSRIIIGYGTSLFLLLVVYIVTLVANTRLKERTNHVEHTYKVMFALESFISRIKDAETGVRGYYITKDTSFLQPYINSERDVDSIYRALDSVTKDSRLQQQRLGELSKAYKTRFDLYKDFLKHTTNGVTDTFYKIKPAQEAAKKSMDKIRRTINIMQVEEKRLLNERDIKLQTTFNTIKTVTIISLLLTLVLVIIGFVTYTSENKARRQGLQKIKAYQDELNKRIEELDTANAQLIKMRSLEKFAATGRIARTIAHEVRNPLTNIDLAASQLKADLSNEDEGMLYYFDVINRNSLRINKLISDLLQSTKFAELNLSKVSLTALLEETVAMAKDRTELQQIVVQKEFDCVSHITADTDKIKIAFLNIIINAIEAMPKDGSGILTIKTKSIGKDCHIIIADNGTGMDETSLSKLFEPYFTNKPKGNGLGLANTQNIIFNHKGNIKAISKLGEGTTFIIVLPIGES
jgi:signal transduction histidine kinase